MPNPLHDALLAPHAMSDAPFLRLMDGAIVTHRTFLAESARLAHALVAAGLEPGDRLAAQIAKSPEALALYAACLQAGIVFLPLNTAYTPTELDYFIADSGAALVICDRTSEPALRPVAEARGAALLTLNPDGTGTLPQAAADHPDAFAPVSRAPDDLAALLYTSGTTGRSKGAMLTHANLLSNAEALRDVWRFTRGDILLHALPIFHTHGLFVATNITLLAGGSMIFVPKFDPDQMIALLPSATAMMGVPTFYTRLLDDPRLTRDLVAHMRLFISGSAPLLEETHTRFSDRTGHRILERYGMTETNMNTSNPYDGDRRPGTVGMPLPGVELRVMDGDNPVAPGEVGQVEIRGPNVFKGYWNNPEKTREELRGNGFFRTGDLGRVDADGYLHIVGRGKDLIISGGFNIYPKEVESALDAIPGILESAVIGVPHPDMGEGVVGVLVSQPGTRLDPEVLLASLRDSLARFKQPRRLFFVDALPRNAMGKVQKAELRATFADAFAPA